MTIAPLVKITLYGASSQQASIIDQLQTRGCIHLINLVESEGRLDDEDETGDARDALRYLRACQQRLRQTTRSEKFDRDAIVRQALELKRREEQLSDERDAIQKALIDLEPWGEFRLPDSGRIGAIRFWFYLVPLHELPRCESLGLTYEVVNRDARNAFVVVLNADEPTDPPGAMVRLDRRPMSELKSRMEDIDELLEELRYQRVGLTRWCKLLAAEQNLADDAAQRKAAAELVLAENSIFAIQGWMPRSAEPELRQLAQENGLAISIEEPSDADQPPTLLENPDALAGSESLMTFYKIPEYRAWDPSLLSFVSFAIFFAMIVADAGYGAILLLISGYFWRSMGRTQNGRRGRNILVAVSTCTLIYGVLCGSYFGVAPGEGSLLGALAVIDAQSQSQMMPLTIGIGVVHLSIAHLVMAWLKRGRAAALASLGWVSVMLGASLAAIGSLGMTTEALGRTLTEDGAVLLVVGLGAVFLFSSERPLFSTNPKDYLMRLVEGLQGLTGLSGLFGDALSYLRLFALGLSSAKLSETFNELGANAWDAAGFGVIASIGIVLLGHTLNLLLSIMSGVVHGLRLNCIEFYKWSLPEDGYSFNAFAKKAKEK